jgi:hypothetical protein
VLLRPMFKNMAKKYGTGMMKGVYENLKGRGLVE